MLNGKKYPSGQTFGYDYDPIGNRTWSKRGDHSREYEANELNQYTSRDVPDVAHLLRLREEATAGQVGSADTNATVTVNSQSVTRQNAYWYKDLAVTNDTDPQYPEVVIDATWSNLLSSVTGNVFVAETPEDFGYDADGNMTNDGRFAYTWDGENRLVAVETLTNVVAASGAPQVRVEYAYDYMSRRIGKTVLNAYTNGAYTTTNQIAYLYDGWNLVRSTTLSDDGVTTNCYVWGLDLSGTLQGAGGIGGLLSMIEGRAGSPSTAIFFTADANGNIGQLLDAANPTNILAHYEYSPFGETLVAIGDLAKANPFRFSTKYHEDESGLVYYGYRYYKPDIGRWVNRDPIEEAWKTKSLYVFCNNRSVLTYDLFGLTESQSDYPLFIQWMQERSQRLAELEQIQTQKEDEFMASAPSCPGELVFEFIPIDNKIGGLGEFDGWYPLLSSETYLTAGIVASYAGYFLGPAVGLGAAMVLQEVEQLGYIGYQKQKMKRSLKMTALCCVTVTYTGSPFPLYNLSTQNVSTTVDSVEIGEWTDVVRKFLWNSSIVNPMAGL